MSKEKRNERVSKITALATDFCAQKLDEDYFALTEKVIGLLSEIEPNPMLRGKEEIWAAGIISAIGYVNFLHDKSTEPFVSTDELNDHFGTKKSSVSNKSASIRKMLNMSQITGFEFMTKGMKEQHPLFNMVMVDGLIVPISSLPKEYQKMAREAKENGEEIEFYSK